jgi:hypothetical protein
VFTIAVITPCDEYIWIIKVVTRAAIAVKPTNANLSRVNLLKIRR